MKVIAAAYLLIEAWRLALSLIADGENSIVNAYTRLSPMKVAIQTDHGR
ncbi:hypothetical protein [Lacticaseibacillus manihotivorans]|nr:hypothetical protein [Lacticaseibacillus manihotivorans]